MEDENQSARNGSEVEDVTFPALELPSDLMGLIAAKTTPPSQAARPFPLLPMELLTVSPALAISILLGVGSFSLPSDLELSAKVICPGWPKPKEGTPGLWSAPGLRDGRVLQGIHTDSMTGRRTFKILRFLSHKRGVSLPPAAFMVSYCVATEGKEAGLPALYQVKVDGAWKPGLLSLVEETPGGAAPEGTAVPDTGCDSDASDAMADSDGGGPKAGGMEAVAASPMVALPLRGFQASDLFSLLHTAPPASVSFSVDPATYYPLKEGGTVRASHARVIAESLPLHGALPPDAARALLACPLLALPQDLIKAIPTDVLEAFAAAPATKQDGAWPSGTPWTHAASGYDAEMADGDGGGYGGNTYSMRPAGPLLRPPTIVVSLSDDEPGQTLQNEARKASLLALLRGLHGLAAESDTFTLCLSAFSDVQRKSGLDDFYYDEGEYDEEEEEYGVAYKHRCSIGALEDALLSTAHLLPGLRSLRIEVGYGDSTASLRLGDIAPDAFSALQHLALHSFRKEAFDDHEVYPQPDAVFAGLASLPSLASLSVSDSALLDIDAVQCHVSALETLCVARDVFPTAHQGFSTRELLLLACDMAGGEPLRSLRSLTIGSPMVTGFISQLSLPCPFLTYLRVGMEPYYDEGGDPPPMGATDPLDFKGFTALLALDLTSTSHSDRVGSIAADPFPASLTALTLCRSALFKDTVISLCCRNVPSLRELSIVGLRNFAAGLHNTNAPGEPVASETLAVFPELRTLNLWLRTELETDDARSATALAMFVENALYSNKMPALRWIRLGATSEPSSATGRDRGLSLATRDIAGCIRQVVRGAAEVPVPAAGRVEARPGMSDSGCVPSTVHVQVLAEPLSASRHVLPATGDQY